VKETIKRVQGDMIVETLPRARLAQAQTPQIFRRAQLLNAHHSYNPDADLPDDATLALLAGIPLALYPGGPENMKVTTPEDLAVVAALALTPQPPSPRGKGERRRRAQRRVSLAPPPRRTERGLGGEDSLPPSYNSAGRRPLGWRPRWRRQACPSSAPAWTA
jgi:hypothetical protein